MVNDLYGKLRIFRLLLLSSSLPIPLFKNLRLLPIPLFKILPIIIILAPNTFDINYSTITL